MSKVNKATLSSAKLASKAIAVDQVITDHKNNEFTITQIDVTENATYIEVIDSNEKTNYYGQKIFLSNFKL